MSHRARSSATCSPGQMLVLIGSDGKRATVSRAVATEASCVLRDLLDGVEDGTSATVTPTSHSPFSIRAAGPLGNAESPPARASAKATGPLSSGQRSELDDLFFLNAADSQSSESDEGLGAAGKTASHTLPHAQPSQQTGDIMDVLFPSPTDKSPSAAPSPPAKPGAASQLDSLFGGPATAANSTAPGDHRDVPAHSATSGLGAAGPLLPPLPPHRTARAGRPVSPPHPSRCSDTAANAGALAAPPPLEVPFPYFTGGILQIVCRHMRYRYRISAFGAEDGYFRVFPVKTREIPRPMVLPLSECLDVHDRKLVQDWDEITTVLVVKCATLLNYEELLNLASAKLASYLMERSVEGLRTLLGVESDFSPQEEAELKKEHQNEGWK